MGFNGLPNRSCETDIFLTDSDFYLEGIPCEMITGLGTLESPCGSHAIRQSAVQFGELTPRQKSGLKYFIQNYTVRSQSV